jgi:hypothetical protein
MFLWHFFTFGTTVRAKVKDTSGFESPWETLEVSMPVSHQSDYFLIQWILDHFPHAFPILRQLIGL